MSSASKGPLTSSTIRSAEPSRLPVASAEASSSSTRLISVATSQSASRAIVCPTARVRFTAMSKSIAPLSTTAATFATASASARV